MNDRAFGVTIQVKRRLFRKPIVTVVITDGMNDMKFDEPGGAFIVDIDKPIHEPILRKSEP